MIKGIGTDVVLISRIEGCIKKHGMRFLSKVHNPEEIELCARKAVPAVYYAGRWAVKEAFYKALPDHCQKISTWKSIMVLSSDGTNAPVIIIREPRLAALLEETSVKTHHVSISHEKDVCVAFVVLE